MIKKLSIGLLGAGLILSGPMISNVAFAQDANWEQKTEGDVDKSAAEAEEARKKYEELLETAYKKETARLEEEAKKDKAFAERMALKKKRLEERKNMFRAKSGPQPIGCFKDMQTKLPDLKGRDLDGMVVAGKKNTGASCVAYCKSKGFKYAGTQWGKYCGCGNSYGKFGPATNCDKPCTGNPKEMCGGGLANTVFDANPSMAVPDLKIEDEVADTATTATTAAATTEWVKGSIPAEAVLVGTSGGKPMNVCRAKVPNGELHAGKAWNNNCYVGFGGKEIKSSLADGEVLVLKNVAWVAVADGKMPETAYQMGMSGGKPMGVCRAKVPNGEMHAGKAWNGNCYVGFGGKEVKSNTFEAMTVTK